jgi:hypothetical protein
MSGMTAVRLIRIVLTPIFGFLAVGFGTYGVLGVCYAFKQHGACVEFSRHGVLEPAIGRRFCVAVVVGA